MSTDKRVRVWSVPVYAYATTAIEFATDVDPNEDPSGFMEAFDEAGFDFPTVNSTNDFEIDGEWGISLTPDGVPDVSTNDE